MEVLGVHMFDSCFTLICLLQLETQSSFVKEIHGWIVVCKRQVTQFEMMCLGEQLASIVGSDPGSSRSRGKMERPHGSEFWFAFSL